MKKKILNLFALRAFMILAFVALSVVSCESSNDDTTVEDDNTTQDDTLDQDDDDSQDDSQDDTQYDYNDLLGSWIDVDTQSGEYCINTFYSDNTFTNVYYYADGSYDEGFKATISFNGCVIKIEEITHLLNDEDGSFDVVDPSDLDEGVEELSMVYEFVDEQLYLYTIFESVDGTYETLEDIKVDYELDFFFLCDKYNQ